MYSSYIEETCTFHVSGNWWCSRVPSIVPFLRSIECVCYAYTCASILHVAPFLPVTSSTPSARADSPHPREVQALCSQPRDDTSQMRAYLLKASPAGVRKTCVCFMCPVAHRNSKPSIFFPPQTMADEHPPMSLPGRWPSLIIFYPPSPSFSSVGAACASRAVPSSGYGVQVICCTLVARTNTGCA